LANNIPLDKDNDLVQLNDNLTIASGIVTFLRGPVLDSNSHPVKGALIELWHADREGNYPYSPCAHKSPTIIRKSPPGLFPICLALMLRA
jgi:protocatechuate 3,4-dioxygenase beta subunit